MELYTNREIDVVLAGVLATEEDLEGARVAIVNIKNYIQCRIKVISDLPSYIPQDEFFTFYSSQLVGFTDDTSMDDNYRINMFIQYLQDKIILFKPYIQKELNKKSTYKVSNGNSEFPIVMDRPEKIGNDNQLVAIPYVEDYHDYELEKRLLEGRAIGKLNYFDEMDSPPQFILNGGCIYGEFTNYKKTSGGWILESIEKTRKLRFSPEKYNGYLINYNSKIAFISEDLIINIIPQLIKEKGEVITGLFEYHEEEIEKSNFERKNKTNDIDEDFQINKITKEEDFLEFLKENIKKANLVYDEKDLISFHTSIKTGSLVILNGMSGTGKSKLVDVYAQSLGINNPSSCQYKMIPVKPNWNDDTDLIGFLDTVNNIYRPAESGLVDMLIEAQNSDKLYLICFDEMNLARVEHYFSQFLSVLEMETNSRKLTLYNPKLKERVFNSIKYPPEIEIGDNIIFIGTINTDESTHQFSDKVLDRSNLITSNMVPFFDWKNKAFEPIKKSKPLNIISYNDFNGWRNREKQPIVSDRELEFLQTLHNYLQSIDSMKGIGYRIIVQIDKFLKNLPDNLVMDRRCAFDYQVVQRILPKLIGTEEQLKELLGNKNKKGKLFELIEKYNDVSDFEKTHNSFERKLKELIYNGYTL